MVKLKYLGLHGPNGEGLNEVREYDDEKAAELLRVWPNHFVIVERVIEKEPEKKAGRQRGNK